MRAEVLREARHANGPSASLAAEPQDHRSVQDKQEDALWATHGSAHSVSATAIRFSLSLLSLVVRRYSDRGL